MKLVHDRFSVEVMRGCTQGCRFCQAGYWYRPNRELKADDVVDLARQGLDATGESELGLLSLSTADYGPVEKVLDALIDQEDFEDISLSLPSLRANSFGQGLARKAAALNGGKSATFAPETGSERLRKMINKTISDKDMYEAAESVFANGFHNIKLYTMVGLPTENLDDMRAFCGLIANLNAIGQKYSRRNTVHASIGILVPKPFTPMQWVPFMDEARVDEHIRFVREAFRYVKSVRISWSDYGLSHVESLLFPRRPEGVGHGVRGLPARAGVRILQRAFQLRRAGRRCGRRTAIPRSASSASAGWTRCSPGTSSMRAPTRASSRTNTRRCSRRTAPPCPIASGATARNAASPATAWTPSWRSLRRRYQAKSRTPEEIKALAAARKRRREGVFPYHLVYRKSGLARFIAHQATLDLFEKGFRRLRIPLNYSEGFNPRPVIKNTGALPLGLESRQELLVVEFRQPLAGDPGRAMRPPHGGDARRDGNRLRAARQAQPHAAHRDRGVPQRAMPGGEPQAQAVLARYRSGDWRKTLRSRDKDVDLTDTIMDLWSEDGELCLRARTQPSGATISPYLAFAGLLDEDPEAMRSRPIYKAAYTVAAADAIPAHRALAGSLPGSGGRPGGRMNRRPGGGEDLGTALERLDLLLAETKDPERLRMGMGIRLALGMAQELRQGAALGSQTSDLVAAWTEEHGQEAVDRAVQIAREFLLKPDELRKAMAQRLGLDGQDGHEGATDATSDAAEADGAAEPGLPA